MKRRSKGVKKRRIARRISRKAAKGAKRAKRKPSVSKRLRKPVKPARPARHAGRAKARQKQSKPVRKAAKPAAAVSAPLQKAAAEVPTLEQVTITCANCGKPFRLFKLKGLSLEGTICQRCSLGEVELPESFG